MGLPGWHFYEYFIRKAAGMGDGTKFKDPDKYDKKHVHCDILIVGGGPTGISAAVTAGRAGARVILVDNHPKLGGQLNGERYFLDKNQLIIGSNNALKNWMDWKMLQSPQEHPLLATMIAML